MGGRAVFPAERRPNIQKRDIPMLVGPKKAADWKETSRCHRSIRTSGYNLHAFLNTKRQGKVPVVTLRKNCTERLRATAKRANCFGT